MDIKEYKTEVLPLKNKLYRFAKRLLNHAEEAEDAVQEVLIRLWQKRNKLNNKNIEAFAMIVTKNRCIDKIRAKRRNLIKLEETMLPANDSSPYNQIELADSIEKVHQIIKLLPDRQKMIFQLRDIEGYTYDEIAEVMQLSKNVIKVNLYRARKKIRELLLKKYNYEHHAN